MTTPRDPLPDQLVAVHLAEFVCEIGEDTEQLIRAGHMGELTSMPPAEVDQFVQRLRAMWQADIDPPTRSGGAP